jgi:hypothetical protein
MVRMKPSINDVMEAFNQFSYEVRVAVKKYLFEPNKRKEEITKAQNKLREKFRALGIEDFLSWTIQD